VENHILNSALSQRPPNGLTWVALLAKVYIQPSHPGSLLSTSIIALARSSPCHNLAAVVYDPVALVQLLHLPWPQLLSSHLVLLPLLGFKSNPLFLLQTQQYQLLLKDCVYDLVRGSQWSLVPARFHLRGDGHILGCGPAKFCSM